MVKKKPVSRRINRRHAILQAAAKLILARGLSGVTTRQIARETGCSEGALYVHFHGRLELLLAMLEESLPEMLGPLQILQKRVGRGSPQANLATALGASGDHAGAELRSQHSQPPLCHQLQQIACQHKEQGDEQNRDQQRQCIKQHRLLICLRTQDGLIKRGLRNQNGEQEENCNRQQNNGPLALGSFRRSSWKGLHHANPAARLRSIAACQQ